MNAYIYRAALYCEECGDNIRNAIASSPPQYRMGWQEAFNSDAFPQPVVNGGGEADSPAHCDNCRVFLENPLTDDGRDYVAEAIEAFDLDASGDADTINEWRAFYADTLD